LFVLSNIPVMFLELYQKSFITTYNYLDTNFTVATLLLETKESELIM